MSRCLQLAAAWAFSSITVSYALQEQVVSSFVFSRYGDRTPLISDEQSILTPYGAQQMYDAGSSLRERYLTTTFDSASETSAIRDISQYQLSADEITIYSTNYQYTVASAQAFMQGLYPPLADSASSNHTEIAGVSNLANNTNIVAPLNGYQYPEISTTSSYDLRSVWLDASQNCPAYTGSLIEYYNTSNFDFLYASTINFYQGLEDGFLENNFTPNELGYFDAYVIYDYLQYAYLHNATLRNMISSVNMTIAKTLAADWVYAMYSNATDPVRSIAGRSLATQILSTFYNAIQRQGATNKLNLYFGDFAPMVSFAALAGLTSEQNAIFYDVPPMSSSFIFELVSMISDNDTGTTFPDASDLYVRFFFQNGTDQYSHLVAYPLFGQSPSQILIPYYEFVSGLSKFSLSGIQEWCETCGSYSIFCPAFTSVDSPATTTDSGRKGLSPAVAGVIGAVIALAIAAILFGLLMALAGVRVHRQQGKRQSSLAGFKGSQKLASDQDLTLPKGGAGATVITTEPDLAKGHERVGSWELREQAKKEEAGEVGVMNMPRLRRPSYEDDEIHIDPYAPAVTPHDRV